MVLPLPRGPAKRYAWAARRGDGALEGRADGVLADQVGETLRAVLAGECQVGHRSLLSAPRADGMETAPRSRLGPVGPRHIQSITDRCYLPVLAGFATLNCAGTDRQRRAARRPFAELGLRAHTSGGGLRQGCFRVKHGGDDRDRTGDLLVANEALSQLSYIPTNQPTNQRVARRQMAEREGFEPSKHFHAYTVSNRAPSTTRTSLRGAATGARALPCATGVKNGGERGFEPSIRLPYSGFRDRPIQPLSHLSAAEITRIKGRFPGGCWLLDGASGRTARAACPPSASTPGTTSTR